VSIQTICRVAAAWCSPGICPQSITAEKQRSCQGPKGIPARAQILHQIPFLLPLQKSSSSLENRRAFAVIVGFMLMARQMPAFYWWVISGLALTTTLSILLLYSAIAEQRFGGTFYNNIIAHLAEIKIIVQIVSRLLGTIHMFVLKKLFNLFTVQRFLTRSITLDCLKWWNSVCQLWLETSLPLRFLLPLILFTGEFLRDSINAAVAV
jgi:hypothetical protein